LANREDIAIVGMACMFPGADNPARFWQNIVANVDSITDPPASWLVGHGCQAPHSGSEPIYTLKGGYLGDLCRFAPTDYGLMPVAVDGAEPDQFLALRCAYEALADAGCPDQPLNRERTGVFVGRGLFHNRGTANWVFHSVVVDQVVALLGELGLGLSDDELREIGQDLKKNLPPFAAETVPGLPHCVLTGRIANRLNLQGPTSALDAACASSLIALGQAIGKLRSGECDAALAGGVQVTTPVMMHQLFCRIDALSRSGSIAPFSAHANGTLLGEGCGMVVLKRRSTAERDGNRIYALVKEVGESSDGKGAGLLAPQAGGQRLAIARAYEQAGATFGSVGLIEAHGTGIPRGDQCEIESLVASFGQRVGLPNIALGSVKSMIGHLLPAAGIAGLIKTALALYHRVLPPTLHAEAADPELERRAAPFYLPTQPRPWIHGDQNHPRRAGVNAFGFGGINAHAIVEEYPHADEPALMRFESDWPVELVVVSAEDRAALCQRVEAVLDWVQQSDGLRLIDVAATCSVLQGSCRLTIVAKNVGELVRKLQHALKLLADPATTRIQDRSGIQWQSEPLLLTGRLAFIFPGEGSQHPNMLADLCRFFPEVRREFDRAETAFARLGLEQPLSRLLFPLPDEKEAAQRKLLQLEGAVASVILVERALLGLLDRLEIRADAFVGHSSGEFAALWAAGAYELPNEAAVIDSIANGAETAAFIARSGLATEAVLTAVGGLPRAAIDEAMAASQGRLVVAMDNCPHQVILAGDEVATAEALQHLQCKGGLCERLAWGRSYHTSGFYRAREPLAAYFRGLGLAAPRRELWSCATAGRFPDNPADTLELAVCQWHQPVRFRETVEAMYDAGIRCFVEVGPGASLAGFVDSTLGNRPHAAVSLCVARRSGCEQLCRALSVLIAHGLKVNPARLFSARQANILEMQPSTGVLSKRPPVLDQSLPCLKLSAPGRWRRPPAELTTEPSTAAPPSVSASDANVFESALKPPSVTEASAVQTGLDASDQAEQWSAQSATNSSWPAAEPISVLHTEAALQPTFAQTHQAASANTARSPSMRLAAFADLQHTLQNFLGVQDRVSQQYFNVLRRQLNASQATSAPPCTSPSEPQPLLGVVSEHLPGALLVAHCELDATRYAFLKDHSFFGHRISASDPQLPALPVMPLAMSLEVMAEAACQLCPKLAITALSRIQTHRWLTFEGLVRKLVVRAEASGAKSVHVTIREDDRQELSGAVAEATFEFADQPQTLGASRLPKVSAGQYSVPSSDIYGRILFHGPAFQGIEHVEACQTEAASVSIRLPDPTLLWPGGAQQRLPAVLIDVAGQIIGIIHSQTWAAEKALLTFPNGIDRVEFRSDRLAGPLKATARMCREASFIRSDVEMCDARGEVVFRAWGRVDAEVPIPGGLYGYWPRPERITISHPITGLFRGVPGIEHCAICTAGGDDYRLIVNQLWRNTLARMILGGNERDEFERRGLAPVPAASALLGRAAAKDAVRSLFERPLYMADIAIEVDHKGRPHAKTPAGQSVLVSIAHKGLMGVGIGAMAEQLVAVGIDVEPIARLHGDLVADAFSSQEQQVIRATASNSAAETDRWLVAAWCAKEAVGKALGGGLPQGPRGLVVKAIDAALGRVEIAAPQTQTAPAIAALLSAYVRQMGHHLIAICLVPRESLK
jgi:acyl transferase domain-containing protein/phosphopantetheinyl transferase